MLYGALMAGLLFVAFAFFAVAQAGSVRNGGQSAADAAALAAAQDDRAQFYDGFLDAVSEGGDGWRDWLEGIGPLDGDGCGEASRFAARNRSDLLDCEQITRHGDPGYTVRVRTRFDTGDTFLPGADHRKATATATAVLRPRCSSDEEGDDADEIGITCEDEEFTVGPDDQDTDVRPSDLFAVVLVD
nr:hypothetical protein [Streptomyces albus]